MAFIYIKTSSRFLVFRGSCEANYIMFACQLESIITAVKTWTQIKFSGAKSIQAIRYIGVERNKASGFALFFTIRQQKQRCFVYNNNKRFTLFLIILGEIMDRSSAVGDEPKPSASMVLLEVRDNYS